MDDLISRQAAIELILNGKVDDDSPVECPEECNSFLEWAAEEVGKMPSAERKKGEWIVHPGGKFVGFPYVHYECSLCRDFEPEERPFCPNCGADMRGEQDE